MNDASLLGALRRRIDALDRHLVRLLDRRAALVIRINRRKRAKNLPRRIPSREREVHANIQRASRGIFPRRALRQIYQRLLLSSYRLGAKRNRP